MNLFKNLDESLPEDDKRAFKVFVVINCCVVIILASVVCFKVISLLIMKSRYEQSHALVLEKSPIEKQAMNSSNFYKVRLLIENEIETELETPAEFRVNQVIPVYYNPTSSHQIEYDEFMFSDIGLIAALLLFLIFLIIGIKNPESVIPYLQGGS